MKIQDVYFPCLTPKYQFFNLENDLKDLTFDFTLLLDENTFKDIASLLQKPPEQLKSCVWKPISATNLGFDFLIPFIHNEEIIWLAIENKWTPNEGNTKIDTRKDLVQKYKNTKLQFEGTGLRFIFILLAYRDIPNPQQGTIEEIGSDWNYIVVDKKGCEKLFGPSMINIMSRE